MYHFFDRPAMKARAKANLKRNYWPAFAVTLIIALAGGAVSSGPSFNFSTNFNLGEQETVANTPFSYAQPQIPQFVWVLLGVLAVFILIVAVCGIIHTIFAGNVLSVGGNRFFLNYTNATEKFGDIAHGFSAKGKTGYFNVVKVMFLRSLYLFLWGLLMLVPILLLVIGAALMAESDAFNIPSFLLMFIGIVGLLPSMIPMEVKAYEYSMVPYLLAEYPQMPANEVFAASKQLTNGYKWELFVLHLSFIGWELLGALCFGIGSLFVRPYVAATEAEAYVTLCAISNQKQAMAAAQQPPVGPIAPSQPQGE